jgi:signal peptidase I
MQRFTTEQFPDPQFDERQRSKESALRFGRDILETLVLSVIIFLAINTVSARIRVVQSSMQPTLYEGDFVIVNKLAYKMGEPGRGDVIVFQPPTAADDEPFIKRVIGLPGEQIEIQNGKVFVNGQEIHELYIKAPPNYAGHWLVPQGHLFVLGDNRNNSSDSHNWGYVPQTSIIGKALVVYLPVSHWQVLNPSVAAAAGP